MNGPPGGAGRIGGIGCARGGNGCTCRSPRSLRARGLSDPVVPVGKFAVFLIFPPPMYARAIQEQVNSNPQLQAFVRVRLLQRVLNADPEQQQAEALAVGRRLHAAFVLRTLAIEGVQEPWLTVVDQPNHEKDLANSTCLQEVRSRETLRNPIPCIAAQIFHSRLVQICTSSCKGMMQPRTTAAVPTSALSWRVRKGVVRKPHRTILSTSPNFA